MNIKSICNYSKFLILIFFISGIQISFSQQEKKSETDTLNLNRGIYLKSPLGFQGRYNPQTKQYILQKQIGGRAVGPAIYMTREEYMKLLLSKNIAQYYKEKTQASDEQYRFVNPRNDDRREGREMSNRGLVLPSLQVKNKIFETVFGGNKIELIPKGYASIDLGILYQNLENPQILPKNRKSFAVDLQQQIKVGMLGKVGKNLELSANYDTKAGFAFENRMNLAWRPNMDSGEDNILQGVEFGNVSLPLNTSLIRGAQSLFGAKAELKFGDTYVTTLFSQQESESRQINIQNGNVVNQFKIYAKDYDANKHYFLSQYFRNNYDRSLANYPFISSQVNITRLEVWVVDKGNSSPQNRRAILALRDLGDASSLPSNGPLYERVARASNIRQINSAESVINSLSLVDRVGNSYTMGEHYLVHQNVRLMNPSEYKFYPNLGFISLNQALGENELLAVSFQYTLTNQPGKVYSVGELSSEQNKLLLAKLIKSNANTDTNSPMWDLMMKNIYSLDTYQLTSDDFRLNILYQDNDIGTGGVNYLSGTEVENQTLLQILNMDRLNRNGQIQQSNGIFGDGLFDYLPGVTIDQENARIIFSTVEPFGTTIDNKIKKNKEKYVVKELYDILPIYFEQNEKAKRYYMQGQYKSSNSGGIPLGAYNVPRGSVKVTANGVELLEGVDYTVDYQLGRVNLINQNLVKNGANIQINLENRSSFNLQTKRLMGVNVEHHFSDNFILGGTFMNYQEKPIGSVLKAQYNSEPVSNSIFGANILYNTKSEWLTRLTDKIPFVDTNQESKISFTAEAAYLKPGTNKSIQNQAYIDDFEDSQTSISLMDPASWQLAATPIATLGNPNDDFNPTVFNPDNFTINYNRRLVTWYNIDPRFYKSKGDLSNSDLSNHSSRRVNLRELFSSRDVTAGTSNYISTLDVTYFPEERGPYNLNPQWEAENKRDWWAGITRPLSVTNLTQSNVEYIEFWMMDPYLDGLENNPDAKMLLHLGNVSEDILRDGNLFYENGLKEDGQKLNENYWGKQPTEYPILYSFDTNEANRARQDLGYDGLSDEEEKSASGYDNFANWQNQVTGKIDPAADDFVYYFDDAWKGVAKSNYLPNRYKYYRNPQGNSPANTLEASTSIPDSEDANQDYNLDRIERYNQYSISLSRDNLNRTNPLIVDEKTIPVTFENKQKTQAKWYLFRIPLSDYDKNAGAASNDVFNNSRFMRMILKGFTKQVTLRFGSFDMVRSEWIKYRKNIHPYANLEEGTREVDNSNISMGIVNIEENSTSTPPYVTPPGIHREQIQTNVGVQNQNEASMVLNISEIKSQDARGVFKNVNLDLRRYKKLKMFTHIHAGENGTPVNKNLKLFIRLGSDLNQNYYEYEIPLEYSSQNAVSPTSIWPENNSVDVDTELFTNLKKEYFSRATLERYGVETTKGSGKYVYIKGKPSLGNISTIMIGVRNTGTFDVKKAILWINELRLSEIENEGGYAANATLNMNLGDLARINATGSMSTVGFGAIDRAPVERQQEEIKSYSVNTSLNIDKFFPEKWGLKVPLEYTIQEEFIDPKYNPLDNDIEFKKDPRKNKLQEIVRTYRKTTTLALNNITKVRTGDRTSKQKFYDIENFGLSFLYKNDYFRDIYTAYDMQKDLRASLNYNYQFKSLDYRPFKEWDKAQEKAPSARYLRWAKEVNINPIPSRIGFRTEILRTYNEQLYRDLFGVLANNGASQNLLTHPVYSNNFLFNWQYNVGFDLTKSLRIDYDANTRTLASNSLKKPNESMIFRDLFKAGTPINYNQQLRVNYKTPLHLLPYMEWLNADVSYTALYDWNARLSSFSIIAGNEENLGNLSQNSQSWAVNGTLNFEELYNQFDIFKKLNEKKLARQNELDSLQNVYKNLSEQKNGLKQITNYRYTLKNKLSLKDYLLSTIQGIKRAQFTFNKNRGIILPGVLGEPSFIGTGKKGFGPGVGFIFGDQRDIRRKAVENGWITSSEFLTEPYSATSTQDFTANMQIEPSSTLLIDLNARRNLVENLYQSGYNIHIPAGGYGFEKAFENRQQNFTISTISLATSTKSKNELFKNLIKNAQMISAQRGAKYNLKDTDNDGFVQGFGLANADVLLPAFLKTYQGQSLDDSENIFKKNIPLPNWNITYTGLSKNPFLSKYFDQFEVSHSYISTYTVGGVQSNINYFADPYPIDNNGKIITKADGEPISGLDGNANLYTPNIYGSVSLIESFAPLVGIDIRLRNNMQIKAQYNRDRFSSLSLNNHTLAEDYSNEMVFGFGYMLKDIKLKMRYMGKRKVFSGDVNLRADLSMRDSETSIRRILQNNLQINGGQRIFSLRFNAEYLLTDNFNVSLYYEQLMNKYKISTAFPLTTVRAGVSATFSFGK